MSGQKGSGPGVLATTVYSSGNIAVPIPDANPSGVNIPITVPNADTLEDVNVRVRLNHTFDGDLAISLIHPDGTVIALVTNRGAAGDNFGSGANDTSGTPTILDDAAATAISAGVAPFAGTFRPESPLSALNGKPANGVWNLHIVDGFALDTGTVGAFSLELTTFCSCPEIQPMPPPVLVSEGISPPNNAPDPNETVTVNLTLANVGLVNTANLVATLQASGGVVNPSGPQNYGAVIAGGATVTRPFTFTATGACGGFLTLTLALQDGATDLGFINYTLRIGIPFAPVTFANSTAIVVPGTGTGASTGAPAAPYPSNMTVSGMPGTVEKLIVKLFSVSHTFPSDMDVLLVSPNGSKILILSDLGGGTDAVSANLTFDDDATGFVGASIVTGTFKPTNIGTGDLFPASAPVGPYSLTTLDSAFSGGTANGTWSLYVVDDAAVDTGNINGGWSLTITPSGGTCQTATVPSAPTGAAATPLFGKATVTFNASTSNGGSAITGYTVVSQPAGGVDSNAGSTGLSHRVTGLTNGTVYTFRVRATNLVGNSLLSAATNSVMPPGLTDYPFVAGVTPVKAVHISELRQRIQVQRARFGLALFPFTDGTLSPGALVRAVHITELRIALQQAYAAAGHLPPLFTDPALGPGVPIKLIHIVEIQVFLGLLE